MGAADVDASSSSSIVLESAWWHRKRSQSSGQLTGRAKGYAYGVAAVMLISPDAMLCRLPAPEEDVLLVTAMRCAWIFFFCTLTLIFQNGCSVSMLIKNICAHLRPLLLVGLTVTVTSTGFPLSLRNALQGIKLADCAMIVPGRETLIDCSPPFRISLSTPFLLCFPPAELTGSAEALLLISLSPLWGAVIGWRCLGDRLPLRTKLAVFGALVSIALIFAPRIIQGDDADEHPRPNRLLGNVLAIITGVGLGAYGNAIRYTSSRHPNLPAQAAQLFSNFNAMVFCLILAACSSGARPLKVHEPQRLWWVTMLMGLAINTAYLGFNVAPKYINAAEFGVICLLEAVIGPVWVFLLVGEAPSRWTLIGGAVLLSTMISHEVATQLAARPARAAAAAAASAAKARDPAPPAAVAALAMVRVEAPNAPLSKQDSTSPCSRTRSADGGHAGRLLVGFPSDDDTTISSC